jgi:hypothetical protein
MNSAMYPELCHRNTAGACSRTQRCVGRGAVLFFRQKFTLEDAIGSHACTLEANTRVTNGIPLGSSLLLLVCTVNSVQTLKVRLGGKQDAAFGGEPIHLHNVEVLSVDDGTYVHTGPMYVVALCKHKVHQVHQAHQVG